MSRPSLARDLVPSRQPLLPAGLLSRVPLPNDLVDAIAEVLECEANESDLATRAQLLSAARKTLEAWLDGELSTALAVERLAAVASPKSRVVRRPDLGEEPTSEADRGAVGHRQR